MHGGALPEPTLLSSRPCVETLKQQLQKTEASQLVTQQLLQQLRSSLKQCSSQPASGSSADQWISVADPPAELWDDAQPVAVPNLLTAAPSNSQQHNGLPGPENITASPQAFRIPLVTKPVWWQQHTRRNWPSFNTHDDVMMRYGRSGAAQAARKYQQQQRRAVSMLAKLKKSAVKQSCSVSKTVTMQSSPSEVLPQQC